jgi:arylsulfatase A-like enzyme
VRTNAENRAKFSAKRAPVVLTPKPFCGAFNDARYVQLGKKQIGLAQGKDNEERDADGEETPMPCPLPVVTALALTCLGLTAGPAAADQAPARRPNILIVLSDDHSVPHVGCYGNPDIRTPNLDRFAAQGMRFDQAYVTCPQCVPSRASIMTGRSPVAIQMTRFSAPLPAEVRTLPELLRAQGYFAGVAGRTYHLDGSKLPPESKKVFDAYHLRTFPKRLDYVKVGGKRAEMLAQFREFLRLVPLGQPFVLQLCSSDPHRPYDRNAIDPPHFPDTAKVREDFARYYDEIARFDSDFGRVLAILDELGLAENTIVLFMGDNGAALLRGKGTLYDLGLHVPLLVRWPGTVRPGSTSAELISGEDLAPTLLEAAGVAVPRDMTGRGFLKLLRGQPYAGRQYVFAERGAHGSGLPTNTAAFDLGRCVLTRDHKLIYNALWQLPYWPVDFAGEPFWKELQQLNRQGKLAPETARLYFAPTRPMFELYDLKADPAELRNLAGRPEVAAVERQLKAALQEWMILQRDYLPLPIPPGK